MAKFEKGLFRDIPQLPADTQMQGTEMPLMTDAHQFNRVSLRQLDEHIDEIIRQNPDWVLQLEQVINATTINTAYAMGVEKELGSICVGKKANLFI